MYRILAENQAVRERRAQRSHPNHPKPEVVARAPNEVWSWDITRLLGPEKWQYFYLYVILDIFSRYVTGWMVAERETAGLAGQPGRGRPASSTVSGPEGSRCTRTVTWITEGRKR